MGLCKETLQEMSEAVMRQHIDLYVNKYSINLGEEGRTAVNKLLEVYKQDHPGIHLLDDDSSRYISRVSPP